MNVLTNVPSRSSIQPTTRSQFSSHVLAGPETDAAPLRTCVGCRTTRPQTHMVRCVLATDLDADVGRVAVEVRDQHLADKLVEVDVLFDHRLHPGGEGAHQTVGQEHAKKGPDQSAADHLAQNFRRLVDRALDHCEIRPGRILDVARDNVIDAGYGLALLDDPVHLGEQAVNFILCAIKHASLGHGIDQLACRVVQVAEKLGLCQGHPQHRHLQARQAVRVQWPGGERWFAQGETIHTENACKWTVPSFEALLLSAGFSQTRVWTDPAQRFAVLWAAA